MTWVHKRRVYEPSNCSKKRKLKMKQKQIFPLNAIESTKKRKWEGWTKQLQQQSHFCRSLDVSWRCGNCGVSVTLSTMSWGLFNVPSNERTPVTRGAFRTTITTRKTISTHKKRQIIYITTHMCLCVCVCMRECACLDIFLRYACACICHANVGI